MFTIRPFKPFTLNLHGRLVKFSRPAVMGIINITPDSFYAGSRTVATDEIKKRVAEMVSQGADIIDIGACSTRPGAAPVTPEDELKHLETGLAALRSVAPDIPVSVDTFRASVAAAAVNGMGADIINDISGGDIDPAMSDTVSRLNVPYILMHMRGTPETMQTLTDYNTDGGVVASVITSLSRKIDRLHQLGVADIIADPGLGFAKTTAQNYELLGATATLSELLDVPVLIGLSRKSMLTRPLNITADEALEATTAANTIAMAGGAAIIRVHDIAAAVAARHIVELTFNPYNTCTR